MPNKIEIASQIRSGDLLVFDRGYALAFNWGNRVVWSQLDRDLPDVARSVQHGGFSSQMLLKDVSDLTQVHRPHSGKWVGVASNVTGGVERVWDRKALEPEIEITVKVNGKEVLLSDISEETLLKIRELSFPECEDDE